MAIQTAAMRTILANAYGASAAYGALYSTAPGASAGTELTGGSPAYARKALTWAGGNPNAASATFDVPAGSTVAGTGVHSGASGGTYYDGVSLTSQAFASQGTYQVSYSYTQS